MINYFNNKIKSFKNYSIRKKINFLLEIEKKIKNNLDTDSTKSEIEEAKKQSIAIYKAIRKLDKRTGDRFLYYANQ